MPLRKFKTLCLAVKPPIGGLTAKLMLVALLAACYLPFADYARAATIDELNKIKEERKQILEEIERLKKELENTGKETATLKSKIKNLEATGKKLAADIKLTQNQIQSAKLNIEKLNLQIGLKAEGITDKKNSLGEFVRAINEAESANVLEVLIAEDAFSDFFSNIDRMDTLQKEIKSNLVGLKEDKAELEVKKKEREVYKKNTEKLNDQYTDQKELVDINKNKTNKVLGETKNQESLFKKQLADKIAKQKAFEDEIRELEEQIKLEIDKTVLPKTGTGVLKWPLEDISLKSCWSSGNKAKNCVTQFFGNTDFATKNPQIYNWRKEGHPGIDFRASLYTKVKASLNGIVEGIGNTDEINGCYSYGKWVLIRHNNGLSTLYAHLSKINVSARQQVETGQIVGYSGDTGIVDGPHLHFTVYATQGVKITKFTNSINCKNALIPTADTNAYLNPLSYL